MLKAMTHGQSSLTTVHSASAVGALDKLALYLGTGEDRLPPEVAHSQLHQAIDFVVHLDRGVDGRRVVVEIDRGRRLRRPAVHDEHDRRAGRRRRVGDAAPARRPPRPRCCRVPGSTTHVLGDGSAMRPLAGAIVGLLAGAGVWIAIAGRRRGGADRDRPRRPETSTACGGGRRSWRSCLRGRVRWSRVGRRRACWQARAAWVAPMLVGVRRRRDRLTRRSEAVAAWAEMLRDTIASHAGSQEAIAVTARVAPAPIRDRGAGARRPGRARVTDGRVAPFRERGRRPRRGSRRRRRW